MAPKRPLFFYSISPFLVACIFFSPFVVAQRHDVPTSLLVCAFDTVALLMIMALFDHDRFRWFWRAVGAAVFLIYAAYLAAVIVWGDVPGKPPNVPKASELDALRGLIVFGIPGLLFAIKVKVPWLLRSGKAVAEKAGRSRKRE